MHLLNSDFVSLDRREIVASQCWILEGSEMLVTRRVSSCDCRGAGGPIHTSATYDMRGSIGIEDLVHL
jgi:hypothetical protein